MSRLWEDKGWENRGIYDFLKSHELFSVLFLRNFSFQVEGKLNILY